MTPPIQSLVVAPQWIGDAVMSEPLLRRLAARGERLTVGALPWVAPAFRAMACVAEVQEWPLQHGRLDLRLRWRLGRALAGRYQRAYVLPNSIKSALLPWFAGIPARIGYRGEGRAGLLNHRVPNPAERRPSMVAFYAALAAAGPPASTVSRNPRGDAECIPEGAPGAAHELALGEARPRLVLDRVMLNGLCERLGLEPCRYHLFAPGAEFGPAKCWPATHYAELARALVARDGLPVVLVGSPKEASTCTAIADAAATGGSAGLCRSLAGQTSLAEAMALVGGACSVVSNDSGLMHVAAAFGVAQVALFGSTSPLHTPPLNPQARVLWLRDELGLPCMPCFERVCRYGHLRCLSDIGPARVLAVTAGPGGESPLTRG